MNLTKRIAVLLFIVGLLGCLVAILPVMRYRWFEFPNTVPQGLYIDNEENFFCGSGNYARIQMYNKHGTFVRAFRTDVGKGRGDLFTFNVDSGQLRVYVYNAWLRSERLDRKIVYSLDGSLLHATDVPSVEYAGYNVVNEAQDLLGSNYIFKGFLFPRVIKDNGKDRSVVIATPFYLLPFQAPFPAFAFFFIPLLYLAGFKRMFRPRHETSDLKRCLGPEARPQIK